MTGGAVDCADAMEDDIEEDNSVAEEAKEELAKD
jgi:hypothetical protein